MDNEKVQNTLETIMEQFLVLENNIASLKASVGVLKGLAAYQIDPADPAEVLRQFLALEQTLLNADPQATQRQQASDVIEAVKLWRKHGGPHES